MYIELKALDTTSSSTSRLSSATSQRLILPATTARHDVRIIPPIVSTATVGLRQSEVDDATLHMRQAAKNFQVSDSCRHETFFAILVLSDTVRSRRLSFFGHLLCADPWQDHHRALEACIMDSPGDWRWRAGRPRQSWLRTVEADLRPMNLGLATAKRRAQDRSAWRLLVAMATSSTSS